MPDEETPPPSEGRPVLTGLIALIGVAVVVGLILGGGALAVTKVLGLGENGSAADDSSADESFYLPPPEKTDSPSGPLVTLESDPEETESSEKPEKTESAKPEKEITLSAGQNEVSQMEQIDLTGVYPGGEGAILQVQRFEGGKWGDFPVTASVSNETFSTYVQTGQVGENRFRMIDTDSRKTSNVVRVKIR